MFRKEDVRFPAEGGIELLVWLFIPERRATPLSAITMAHGYAGTKYHGLEPMAEAFAEAGFVVQVHDHRGFGDCGGEPRQDVNPWQQITDWRRTISYLQDRQEVDENRVGLWGTSFAGGHAIVLGATERRVKAVVAQVPTIVIRSSKHETLSSTVTHVNAERHGKLTNAKLQLNPAARRRGDRVRPRFLLRCMGAQSLRPPSRTSSSSWRTTWAMPTYLAMAAGRPEGAGRRGGSKQRAEIGAGSALRRIHKSGAANFLLHGHGIPSPLPSWTPHGRGRSPASMAPPPFNLGPTVTRGLGDADMAPCFRACYH
jgi:dienelactone hydrolase